MNLFFVFHCFEMFMFCVVFCFLLLILYSKRDACLFPWYRDRLYRHGLSSSLIYCWARVCDAKYKRKNLGSYLIMNMPYIFCHLEPYITPIPIWIEILRDFSHKIPTNLKNRILTLLFGHFAHYITFFTRWWPRVL